MSRSTQNDFIGNLLQRCHQFRSDHVELTRAVLFGLVGLSGMLIDFGTLYLLNPLAGFAAARAFAIVIAMTWNFALNRVVTFRSETHDSLLRQYWMFVLSCSLGAAVNWSVSLLLVSNVAICREYVLLSAVGGVLAGFLLNFQLCRRWVFGSSETRSPNERRSI